MNVAKIYINTYRYDFHLAKICIASIRYWYPEIEISLIKDHGRGDFNTKGIEDKWNVSVLSIPRKNFGWGYGKLEPLFLQKKESFLVVDADTVFTGPVLESIQDINDPFIVDEESQPDKRVSEIYYNLEKINLVQKDFVYPGYTFNSGQWFGTSGLLTRNDFKESLVWDEPPRPTYEDMFFNGDQGQLNFVLHLLEQQNRITVKRIRLMVWPNDGNADFIDIENIRKRRKTYPYIIHWAGMNNDHLTKGQGKDIFNFYRDYYYSISGQLCSLFDRAKNRYLSFEKKIRLRIGS